MKYYLLNIILTFSLVIQAEKFVVVDAETNEPLSFATITYSNGSLKGTIADIDGKFKLDLSKIKEVKVSYTGYKEQQYLSEELKDGYIFKLEKLAIDLDEVVVLPKKNPAHIIIDSVRKYSEINNPYNFEYFNCKEYVKTKIGYNYTGDRDILGDWNQVIREMFDDSDIFFTENEFRRHYEKPDKVKLILKASNSAGFKEKANYYPLEDIQPFHFYDKNLLIFDVYYFNPIFDDNYNTYYFILKDSIMTDNGMVYQISFRPRNFNAKNRLKGELNINKNRYAIQTISAQPARKKKFHAKLEQNYRFVDNKFWFPSQHNFELDTEDFLDSLSGTMKGRSYFSDISFVRDTTIDFNSNFIELDEDIRINDSLYFVNSRPVQLTTREARTEFKVDSMFQENDMSYDEMFMFMEKIDGYHLYLDYVDLDLLQLYNNNKVEGHRFGLGLITNEDLNDRVYLGGHVAYGSKDEKWKYGVKMKLNVSKKYKMKIHLSYLKDNKLSSSKGLMADNFVYDFTGYEEYKIFSQFLWDYFDLSYAFKVQNITPYKTIGIEEGKYNVTELMIGVKYDYYKKYVPSWVNDYEVNRYSSSRLERYFPIIDISYVEGLEGILGGEYSYSKLEITTSNKFILSEIGELNMSFKAGFVDRDLTYAKLFSGDKLFADESFLYFDNTLQTVKPNEFSSDKYLYNFLKLSFNPIPLPTEYSHPKIAIAQAFGISELGDKIKNANPSLQDMSKGFFESGIIVSDIVLIPVMNLINMGSGVSCFYRWGEYADADFKNNLNIKFVLSFSF
jgi:hypothetical protein